MRPEFRSAHAGGAADDGSLVSSLVGRDDEVARLMALLAEDGTLVVNVTGGVGVGKSSVIDAAVAAGSARFGGVHRLDLTGETRDRVLERVRGVIAQMPFPPPAVAETPSDHRHAPHRRSLLILDRADVLAPWTAELVELAREDGALTLVVESVPRLRGTGCETFPVAPLSDEDAATLFRRIAALVGEPLEDTSAAAHHIVRICGILEGNPLAIDLAARRLPFLTLATLDDVLSSPRRALAALSTPDAALERRSMRQALTASRDGSSRAAQQLLELTSVFTGAFSLEALDAVSEGAVSPCYDALGELLDLRLVELEPGNGGARYRLSRLVRDLAAERLEESSLADAACGRHARYYALLARRAALAADDLEEEAAAALSAGVYTESLEALRWLTSRDQDAALRLAADLGWEALRRGSGRSLATILEQLAAEAPAEDRAARRDALTWLVQLQSWAPEAGDREDRIRGRVAEAVELARELDETLPLLRALRARYLAASIRGDMDEATAACVEGVALATEWGHARWLGRFELSLSTTYSLRREYAKAAALASSGLARALRSGDRSGVVLGVLALHSVPAHAAPDTAALPSLEAVRDITRELGDRSNEMHVLATLANEAVQRGDARAAATWTMERQERVGRADLLHGLAVSVMLAVHVAHLRGDLREGARLHGSVASHVEPLLAILNPEHADQYRAAVDTVRTMLGPGDFDRESGDGALLDRDAVVAELMAYLRGVANTAQGADRPPAPTQRRPVPELTPRELRVLGLLALGRRNKEIATELRITPKTVMHHTVSIYRKLGVRGRAEAATTATRLGLVPLG